MIQMTQKSRKLFNAAKKDKIFQTELKTYQPEDYKKGYLWSESAKIMYAAIYMGYLIGKGTYNQALFH